MYYIYIKVLSQVKSKDYMVYTKKNELSHVFALKLQKIFSVFLPSSATF